MITGQIEIESKEDAIMLIIGIMEQFNIDYTELQY